jgi:Tol biopolymer transport system component
MHTQRTFSLAFSILTLLFLGLGCGGGKAVTDTTPSPTPTPIDIPNPTPQPRRLNGKIVFASNRDYSNNSAEILNSPYDIYIVDADGTNQKRLSIGGADVPSFSRDGSKIVYVSETDRQIYVMNADGSNQKKLTTNGGYFPAFSVDNSKITYTRYDISGMTSEIYSMNADGTNQVQITNNKKLSIASSFSPDGKKIIFSQGDFSVGGFDGYQIYVINADGSNPTRLTYRKPNSSSTNYFTNFPASFSPDGKTIVFESLRDSDVWSEIYTMNVDGSNTTKLTNTKTGDLFPAFSPDGTKIVFRSQRDGNWEIYTMNVDGSNQTRLTNNIGDDAYPSWGGYLPTP